MKALFSAGFIFAAICVWAQPHTYTRLSEMELKGKVKTISYENFSVIKNKDGSIQNIVRGGSFYNYKVIFYNSTGFVDREELYEISGTPEDTVLTQSSRYIYEDGRVVKILNKDRFDKFNNSDFIEFSVDFIYTSDTVYSRVMYDNMFDDTLRVFSKFRYTISKYFHIIDQGVDPDNPFSSKKIYFDDAGRKVSIITEQAGKVFLKCSFEYEDTASLLPEFSEYINVENGRKTKFQYLYNEYNDIKVEIELDETDMKNKSTFYEYEYDQHGNWLEMRTLDEKGQLKVLFRRTITYWDE